MGKFTETALGIYSRNLQQLKGQEDRIFKIVLDNREFKDLIIELNTEIQLGEQSVDSNGSPLFNTLTQRTTYANSDPLGRGGQPYQVFRTGEYWDSFQITVSSGIIIINSNPFKTDNNLFEVYGVDIEGLTEQNTEEIIDEALELFINWYRRNLKA